MTKTVSRERYFIHLLMGNLEGGHNLVRNYNFNSIKQAYPEIEYDPVFKKVVLIRDGVKYAIDSIKEDEEDPGSYFITVIDPNGDDCLSIFNLDEGLFQEKFLDFYANLIFDLKQK